VRRRLRAVVAVLALAGLVSALTGVTLASFSAQTESAGAVTAADDFLPPTVGATVIAKGAGGVPGFVRRSGTYHVYANVTDVGNPASGVQSVTADVSSLTGGATGVALSAGSWTVGAVTYSHRSAQLTVDAGVSEGTKPYTIATMDNDGNSGTAPGSVVVDNTAPAGADVQTANSGGGTVGRPELGDTLTFTFSEEVEPESILAGWTGGPTDVVVRLRNGGVLGLLGNPDDAEVFDADDATRLPLGTVGLGRQDYVLGLFGGELLRFGATGTPSTMVKSGNSVTITLGTASGGPAQLALGNGTMTWTPSATATDRAGNPGSTAPASESGAGDREF
jgi:predicted ribosomally synthesized peptide with SipW-like signal peptide